MPNTFATIATRRARRAHYLFHVYPMMLAQGVPPRVALREAIAQWRDLVEGGRVALFATLRQY